MYNHYRDRQWESSGSLGQDLQTVEIYCDMDAAGKERKLIQL